VDIGPRSNILITFDFVIQTQAISAMAHAGADRLLGASFFAFMRAMAAIVP
jgi:hypothetical protein